MERSTCLTTTVGISSKDNSGGNTPTYHSSLPARRCVNIDPSTVSIFWTTGSTLSQAWGKFFRYPSAAGVPTNGAGSLLEGRMSGLSSLCGSVECCKPREAMPSSSVQERSRGLHPVIRNPCRKKKKTVSQAREGGAERGKAK